MSSTYLERTASAGNRQTWTWSGWVKRGPVSGNQSLFTSRTSGSAYGTIRLEDAKLHIFDISTSFSYQVKTNRELRDPNGWYHFVVAFDTTQATASDRVKMYINGKLETSLLENTYPSENYNGDINKATAHYIGQGGNLGDRFSGSMSHIHFTDGYAYDASTFGSTDSTTGEWKIKTSPSVTYGTNGFFILKDGNSVTDQSGQGNNWTVGGGTLTKTEDNPSNVFATLNPLYAKPQSNPSELTNGNTGVIGGSAHRADVPTIAVNSGKYYMEAKAISGNTTKWWWGLGEEEVVQNKQNLGNTDNFIYGDVNKTQGVYNNNLVVNGSTTISSIFGGAVSANDIVMLAVDLDNQKVWYGLNGTWNNGSASQSTTFNSAYPDSTALTAGDYYYIGVGNENTKWHTNYGNGYFGTTAVSSAGTNASNIGIFEYDVPTGYTALSTKGLNE